MECPPPHHPGENIIFIDGIQEDSTTTYLPSARDDCSACTLLKKNVKKV